MLLDLLVWLLLVLLVFAIAYWIITLIPFPPPIRQVALVILAVILLLVVLQRFLGLAV